MWLELGSARTERWEVRPSRWPVQTQGALVGQWKDLDVGFVLLFRDIDFYLA